MRARERRLLQEAYKVMTGTPFKEGRDLCTFIICGVGTHGEVKVEVTGKRRYD